ncbi:hypothetical protein V1599_04240 [Enterobacter sp. ECC-175]|uniref:hypothetical protein n=1 Tax=unclassified Enterobacter TaxID=2608935 RepID=UPI000D4F5A00|nr:hypothetical protein [Enterobacter sp. RIT 418]RAU33250.1 hypothetical protein DBY73_016385 [Enterobacter sp. RIT 418]
MNSVSQWWLLFFTIMVDLSTSLIILFCAYSRRIAHLHIAYKVGLAAVAFGLFAQSGININFLFTGVDDVTDSVPFWLLQDFGTLLIIFGYFIFKIK